MQGGLLDAARTGLGRVTGEAPEETARVGVELDAWRGSASQVARVRYINLERRTDRRAAQERALREVGMGGMSSRFPATDGKLVRLDSLENGTLTPAAIQEIRHPRSWSWSRLTRGALGLLLTWKALLEEIVADPALQDPSRCVLVTEDDAYFVSDFTSKLKNVLAEADKVDSKWVLLHVGYIAQGDETFEDIDSPLIAKPVHLSGTSGLVIRGAPAAKILLRELLPIDKGSQLDAWLSHSYSHLRVYAPTNPLIAAPFSQWGDTDIQDLRGWIRTELRYTAFFLLLSLLLVGIFLALAAVYRRGDTSAGTLARAKGGIEAEAETVVAGSAAEPVQRASAA